jgi:hypothetical protein
MTIKQLISIRYKNRLAREGGYPVVRTTFYEIVKIRRKRGKEPRRKEDQVDTSKAVGPLGF